MNHSNKVRNYTDEFHQYSFVNETNLPTYILSSDGSTTSSIDHTWHNLNSPRGSYVVSLALSDHYVVRAIFKVKYDKHPKSIRFKDYSEVDAEYSAANIDSEFLYCAPPNSNLNEDAEYTVTFVEKTSD